MTNEQKLLLQIDLGARLPYGVKIERTYVDYPTTLYEEDIVSWKIGEIKIKPYLRPMSSMTEDEEKELSKILNYEFYIDDDFALVAEDDRHRIRLDLLEGYIDWLLAHHFDFRALIEKGLALEAPEGMYKTE